MGGGKRTAPLQSPAPIWPHAVVRGTQMFFAGLQHQHQKSLAGQQHGQRSPAKPGNPRKTWQPSPPCRSELLPKPHQASLEQKHSFHTRVFTGRGPDPCMAFLTPGAGAQQRSGEGTANTLKGKDSCQPQPPLSFCKAGKPGSTPNCTKSHPGQMLPCQQMGFIVVDSSWNKNISPTSRSLFTESH